MPDPRIRREIALLAAQLMYAREESEYFTAKRKAAKALGLDPRGRPKDLPSNAEIRDQIQILAQMHEGEARGRELTAMRLEALRHMRVLARFRPRLIGSVLTGHIRKGSDIDLHVFTDSVSDLSSVLEDHGLEYQVEHKRIRKHNQERAFTHIHIAACYPLELTAYTLDQLSFTFRSSITGKPTEKANAGELEALIRRTEPGLDIESALEAADEHMDPFDLYRLLLAPLEHTKQNPNYHPEGDALYHSLQVFDLARHARPYDEEFLLAALLHDCGKAIDPADHAAAAVEALRGTVTERTLFLIEHHMLAHEYRAGTLGARARQRLAASEYLEDLILLSECDQAGRRGGVAVPTIDEALAFIESLGQDLWSGEPAS